jgi:hypothetical protein
MVPAKQESIAWSSTVPELLLAGRGAQGILYRHVRICGTHVCLSHRWALSLISVTDDIGLSLTLRIELEMAEFPFRIKLFFLLISDIRYPTSEYFKVLFHFHFLVHVHVHILLC